VKKYGFLLLAILLMSSTGAYAQDDTALVDAAINAFNTQDAAYFEKALAPEAVWLDEDGHAIAGKERVTGFISSRVMAEGRKIVTSKVKVFTSGDAAWSHFNYAIESEGHPSIEGLGSAVFKKVGSDWQIVMIHGAHNVMGTH
jgi:ketosteroid isomerase-like protein